MPWVKRPAKGSFNVTWPVFSQRAGEEAGVEQMQDRVLDAADILVDRQPVFDGGQVGRRVPRAGR